jgi:hypothetical protein
MARQSGVLVAAIFALALGLLASPALAAETTVNCAGLQSALTGAKAGDKITLSELCKAGFPYKLPAVQMTLAGTPGAGFDGGSTVQLEGSGAAPTIEGLIFENARNTAANSGGALTLNGAPDQRLRHRRRRRWRADQYGERGRDGERFDVQCQQRHGRRRRTGHVRDERDTQRRHV